MQALIPTLTSAACWHRGVAALVYSEGGGSAGLLYSVGADCQVAALEAATGQQALRFRAGNHPLCAAAASPGTLPMLRTCMRVRP